MSSRFGMKQFRDYVTSYRIKAREKRVNFVKYLKDERHKIIERERKKMWNRMLFWGIFLGGSYFIYNEIYRKKMEITKMNRKLDFIYPNILEKETLKNDLVCIKVHPKNIDELTNLVSLAYRYHYKIIVRMDQMTKRDKIIMCEHFNSKCIFINLSQLNEFSVNEKDNTVYLQTGASCQKVNQVLQQSGYDALFPKELSSEKIYDVIVNNLPLNRGDVNSQTVSLEMISAEGQNFRTAGEVNRYGQIPSLNPLFIGTGGIFALPSSITLKLKKKQGNELQQERCKVDINDDNLKIEAIRKLNQLNDQFIEVQLANNREEGDKGSMFLTCKERYHIFREVMNECAKLTKNKGIPTTKIESKDSKVELSNLFFSVNNSIFQQFLLKFGRKTVYSYKNGLLKVKVDDPQNQEEMISIINEITSNNGVLVWCSNTELLMRIKPSLDSSQVGAELMRKIVQVRQGLDRRNIFYSHSRYESYFAKGMFRRMTELFW